MNSLKTNKFKKGDKVVRVGDTSAVGVEFEIALKMLGMMYEDGVHLDGDCDE